MDMKYDLQEVIDAPTIQSINNSLVERARARRKEQGLTQRQLADRSGVSYASLRRFETMGEISLISLLRIAQVLGCIEDFNALFKRKIITDLKEFEG